MHPGGTGRPGRVFGYARVSSAEQALGTSLQDQQDALARYAAARGLKVTRNFVEAESAVSEKFERREQIQELMRELRAGDLILVDKLDRWSRDIEWTYRSMREIGEANARVYFVGENLDPTTPEGDSLLSMRAVFAREEHKRIRLRTVGTRMVLRDRGFYVEGLPPIGYKRALPRGAKDPEKKNTLVVDKWGASVVHDVYRRCLLGESMKSITRSMARAHTDRSWDSKLIGQILHGRIYLGEIRNTHGIWIKGRHPPIIDAATFAKAQAAIASRKLTGAKHTGESLTKDWLLRKIAKCALCGAKMGSAYGAGVGKNKHYVYYYRCTRKCGARLVPVQAMDVVASDLAAARLVDLCELLSVAPRDAPTKPSPIVNIAERRIAVERRRDRLMELYTDSLMTRPKMNALMAKIDAERLKIDAMEIKLKPSARLSDVKIRAELLKSVTGMRKAWIRMTPEERRSAVEILATSAAIARDAPPVLLWRSPAELADLRL